MKQLITILFFLILFAFTSCKHDDTYYTVKGRILNSCEGNTPFANQEIALKQTPGIFGGGGLLSTTTTDANGCFSLKYKGSESIAGGGMSINCSGPIIEEIPSRDDVDLGTIVLSPICKIVYRVKINNPYTSNDTLSCLNITNPSHPIKIAAPLHDTILGIISASSMNPLQYDTKDFSTIKGGWCIRSNSAIVFLGREVSIQVQNCNTVPDTLTMIID